MKILNITLAILAASLLTACASDDAAPRPQFSAAGDMVLPGSVDELVAASDVVAEVTPVRRLPDHWNSTGTLSAARFELRIDRVHKGDLAVGEVVVAHAPGGTTRKEFGANESQEPRPGDEVMEREYADWPYYQLGRQELVFLSAHETEGLGVYYWNEGPAARYQIEDGVVLRVSDKGVHLGAQEALAVALEGKPLADALALAHLK